MATVIRPEISAKNKYWIDKHRHYELKHFCLQYPSWRQAYNEANNIGATTSAFDRMPSGNLPGDPTGNRASRMIYFHEKMDLIEKIAKETDRYLHDYILKAVTENLSYTYLRTRLNIPCSRDMYYDRYRKFFWLLSEARQ